MADVAEDDRVLYVEVQGDENDGLRVEVGPDGLLIGRSDTCDVIFQNREVSRRHAYFYCDGRRCYVEDLGSKNGLLVNGRRVSRMSLNDGDVVDIGPSRFVLHWDGDVPAPAAHRADALPGGRAVSGAEATDALQHPLAASSFVFAVLAYMHWGFGLGAVILALLSLWEARGEPASGGRALARAGLILGLVGGLLNLWFTQAAPVLWAGRSAAALRQCQENLVEVGAALATYRDAHGGQYPPELEELVTAGLLTAEQIVCPGYPMGDGAEAAYSFLPPQGAGSQDARTIVCNSSPLNRHESGRWVLTAEGRVQWVTGPSFARLREQLRKPAPPGPAAAHETSEP